MEGPRVFSRLPNGGIFQKTMLCWRGRIAKTFILYENRHVQNEGRDDGPGTLLGHAHHHDVGISRWYQMR